MSDAGKTVLWIVVAVAVVAVIIWLFVSAGRRRAAEARRFEASEQRGRAAVPHVEPRASQRRAGQRGTAVATPAAPAAQTGSMQRETAQREAAERESAQREAAQREAERREAAQREAAQREAEVRAAETRRREQEAEQRRLGESRGAGTTSVPASGIGAAAVGAAAFTQEDDDEDDLADAENPFAARPATAVGTGSAETHPEERSTTVTENPASETTDTTSTGSTVFDPETSDGTGATDTTDTTATVEGSEDAATGGSTPQEPVTPPVATIDEPKKVEVPALADRDDVIGEGGTPAGDPGDHRGQPWATTPGQHGPGDSDEPADEGLDVDMAPHSHASDDVDETAEAVSPGNDTPRREEAEPAPDAAAAAFPDEDTPQGHDATNAEHARTGEDVTSGESDAGGQRAGTRRTSSFDEVVDGGFGLGSAAPIGDGAQPLGHAVKARRDGRTFVAPGDAGYDEVEPDVWFYNEDAARRAGFDRRGE
ncbi:hypothetical protein GCM10009740_01520 [Terrabacter terrae]|uniref:Uncharacterized protein n=1 Tax=Terrabacter terrae TaxID=318434 RepID=A0ABN2TR45_9MICO